MSSEMETYKSFKSYLAERDWARTGEGSRHRRGDGAGGGRGRGSRFSVSMSRPNAVGLFSCFPGQIVDTFHSRLEKYYVEAARRLPLQEVDDLVECVNEGGYCIGLADPVSNIILNAVGLLVHRELARPKKTPPKRTFGFGGRATSIEVAKMSRESDLGQRVFMAGYFRHLSRAQARRYLHLASCDLALAINLVRHDRQQIAQQPLLPDGGRTKSALRSAAIAVHHPEPDVLARLMTAQYPSGLLSDVLTKLQGTEPLSVDDLSQVKDLLTRQWPPTPPPVNMQFWCHPGNLLSGSCCNQSDDGSLLISTGIGQDCVAEIRIRTISRFPDDKRYISCLTFGNDGMEAKLTKCLAAEVTGEHACTNPVDELILYLRLRLLDTIHAFYIKALARLPIREDPELLRAILVAGHCYGPMDPVTNIIINSCWFHMAFPLRNQVKDLDLPHLEPLGPGCFDEHAHQCSLPLPYCIIDTKSMTRLAIRSLEGLVTALREGASMSLLQALEFLSTSDCDISRALLHPTIFADAAKAAKHPQHADFGLFLSKLYQDKVIYGLPQSRLGNDYSMVTQHLCEILPGISQQKDEAPPCKLTPGAAGKIIDRKYFVMEMLRFLSAKLDEVLREYRYQHPWEPSFQLDVICGVNEPSPCGSVHHVNFLASSAVTGRTLFFAELWYESIPEKWSSCSPVYDYIECVGRCSFCEKKRSKIIHPPSGGYFGDLDGSLDIDGSHGWLDSEENKSEGLLLTDYVYFDPARDRELGQALNSFHS